MEKEQIYFNYRQICAIENAVKEMEENGLDFNTITIVNNGEGVGSWIFLQPTETRYIIELGMKAAKFLL